MTDLTNDERRLMSETADWLMGEVKLGELAEWSAGVACACVGGLRPGGPCGCVMRYLALKEALLRCGLTSRPEKEDSDA